MTELVEVRSKDSSSYGNPTRPSENTSTEEWAPAEACTYYSEEAAPSKGPQPLQLPGITTSITSIKALQDTRIKPWWHMPRGMSYGIFRFTILIFSSQKSHFHDSQDLYRRLNPLTKPQHSLTESKRGKGKMKKRMNEKMSKNIGRKNLGCICRNWVLLDGINPVNLVSVNPPYAKTLGEWLGEQRNLHPQ